MLVSIDLPYTAIAAKVEQKLTELSKTAKLSGFRPGKVPVELLKQKYGDAALKEVGDEAIKDAFLKDAIDQKIQLAGLLSMREKELEFGKDLSYELEYEVYPKVEAKVPSGLDIELITATVSEDDIESTIQDMRKRLAKYQDTIIGVEARDEHIAIVSYTAATNDAEAHKFSAESTQVDLESDYPSAEFVAAIKGMKAEEEKEFIAKVGVQGAPGGEQTQGMQEREVSFKLKLEKLQSRILPELNQDFFKQFGVSGDEKEFRTRIKSNMEFELQRVLSRIKYKAVSEAITKANPSLQAPETQVTREASRMRDAALKNWSEMSGNKNPIQADNVPLDMFKDRASLNIKTGLFLGELAKSESLEPTEDEVNAAIDELANAYDSPAEIQKRYREDKGLREQVYNKLLEDKALDKFVSMAGAKPKSIDYRQAMEMSSTAGA